MYIICKEPFFCGETTESKNKIHVFDTTVVRGCEMYENLVNLYRYNMHVLSEIMKRKAVESNCFVIILRYQRTVSFLVETILSLFISTVKYLLSSTEAHVMN